MQRDELTMGIRRRSILRMSLSYFGPENSSSNAATSGGRPASLDTFDSSVFDTSISWVFDIFGSSAVDMMAS